MLQIRPIVLVDSPGGGGEEITAIAVYNGDAPISVTTRRVFEGEGKFRFPTEITEGATKTRVVYSYSTAQWVELLETCTMPGAQAGIKQIMIPLLLHFRKVYPGHFENIEYDAGFEPEQCAEVIQLK